MLLIQQTLDYIYFIVLCDAFYCVCCSKPVTDNIQPFVNLHENESLYLKKKKKKEKKPLLWVHFVTGFRAKKQSVVIFGKAVNLNGQQD